MAERLAVELKPKVEKHLKSRPAALAAARSGATGMSRTQTPTDIFSAAEPSVDTDGQLLADAQSALENLGFKDKDVTQAIGKVWKDQVGSATFTGKDGLTALIRGALAELRGW